MSLPTSLRLLLILALLAGASATDLAAQPVFAIETVAADGNSGISASLVLNAQGSPHIAYIEELSHGIRYAVKVAEGWTVEPVSFLATNLTLVLPTGDGPGIARAGEYLRKSNGTWTDESYGTFSGWFSTAALAPNGEPRAVVQWSWGTGLYEGYVDYAARREGAWGCSNFGSAPFIPTSPHASLVIDSADRAHISITVNQGDALRYWHDARYQWETHEFPPGTWSAIVLDDAGNPRISYYDLEDGDLVLAIKSVGTWQITPLDTDGDVGLYTSHVCRDGISHITYYDATEGDLMYATLGPEGLEIRTVATDGDVGRWTSLALDAEGNVHIAYYDATNGDLMYAVGTQPVPVERKSLGQLKAIYR